MIRDQTEAGVEALWQAIGVQYARPGAQDLLLAAQDQAGVDVNLVLLLQARAAAGLAGFDHAAMTRVVAASHRWQQQVLGPLRRARRAAKALDAGLYAALKHTELAAEKAAVRAYLAAGGPGQAAEPAACQVRRYLDLASITDPDWRARLLRWSDPASG